MAGRQQGRLTDPVAMNSWCEHNVVALDEPAGRHVRQEGGSGVS
jgi:hypothetical protein